MELKSYQYKVIKDLERYLEYLQQYKKTDLAFNQFWTDLLGPYDPLENKGMEPYKDNIPGAAHICIKVPTAGGKTFIACNALKTIFNAYKHKSPKTVVWLVPWSNLLAQTVNNLRDIDHPYRRKLNSLFNNRIEVYEKKDLIAGANFNPSVVKEQLNIVVMSFSSLRAKNKDDRKVYQENSNLASFANAYTDGSQFTDDLDPTSLMSVIRNMQPVLIVDESHNAESTLSVEMLNALNPSFILDLTATPKKNSNIISLVPAMELKKEHMVKLPVIVYNHHDKTDVINSALHLQHKLELLAIEEEKRAGKYIRPIVLFQAQSNTNEDNTTFERLKAQLLKTGIPPEQVKIKTANKDELRGVDLMSKDCPVRYIITINALKEGWDCPFAYILASLADRSSAVDVEQILGRVLRQPYVMKHRAPLLNTSYVLTASAKFQETLQNIVEGLQASGFSDNDYREKDMMTEDEKQQAANEPLSDLLFPGEKPMDASNDIHPERIIFKPDESIGTGPVAIADIEHMALRQNSEMEASIQQRQHQSSTENILIEMGDKVKRYNMIAAHKLQAGNIMLPQFFQTISKNIFDDDLRILLNHESLLVDFKLSLEDSKIDFDHVDADLYKVDIDEIGDGHFDAKYTRFNDNAISRSIVAHILGRPRENQVKDIARQLIGEIGDMNPIKEKELSIYVERVLSNLGNEQLYDALLKKWSYARKIKQKISQHAAAYAERRFNDLVKIDKVMTEPIWRFPEHIVPGTLGASIGKSLYEREGEMNQFESSFIAEVAGLQNIAFWHRNLGRGKGFSINGFNSNHYPDFIACTVSGKVIIIETKGGDRDNSDSAAKCRLGNEWARLAGKGFLYFMVFEKNEIPGAYNVYRAKELIRQL